ncbi:MAG: winged helix-turn-helix transcriptional regulator [Candidatus Thorarchaeota archaeon]
MKEEALPLENQKEIYHFIADNPGTHLRRISRELNLSLSTLRYHLDFLEQKGLIVSQKELNLKVYFVVGELGSKDKKISPLLQQKRFRDIILLVLLTPGSTHGEIIEKLSIKPSTLSKYIRILEERQILEHEQVGREKRYSVLHEKLIIKLLLLYRRSFWDAFVDRVLELYFER